MYMDHNISHGICLHKGNVYLTYLYIYTNIYLTYTVHTGITTVLLN